MKVIKVVLTLLLVVSFMSCATMKPATKKVQEQHEVAITLTNMNGDALTALLDSKIDWDKPGILKPSNLLMYDEEVGKAWFNMFSGLSISDAVFFRKDMLFLEEKTDIKHVVILCNSPGGGAFAGLAIAGLIRDYQNKGWIVGADASGIVASAAVPIFAQCRPRKAVDGTIFMVHEAALWKWPGRETASDIRAQSELMDLLRERYMSYLVNNSNLSENEWLLMEAKTSWFSTDKAKEYGLLDE